MTDNICGAQGILFADVHADVRASLQLRERVRVNTIIFIDKFNANAELVNHFNTIPRRLSSMPGHIGYVDELIELTFLADEKVGAHAAIFVGKPCQWALPRVCGCGVEHNKAYQTWNCLFRIVWTWRPDCLYHLWCLNSSMSAVPSKLTTVTIQGPNLLANFGKAIIKNSTNPSHLWSPLRAFSAAMWMRSAA